MAMEYKLKGPIELFKDSWGIYKSRFETLVGISAVPAIAGLLMFLLGFGMGDKQSNAGFVAGLGFAVFIVAIVGIFLGLWSQVAMLRAIKDNLGIKESFNTSLNLVGGYFWVSILTGLAVLGGFILLIIPAFIFAVWYGFGTYVYVIEGTRGWDALKQSKEYVSGNFWAVVGRWFVMGLIMMVLYIPVLILTPMEPNAEPSIVANIYVTVYSLLATPFVVLYSYLLFQELRQKKQIMAAPQPQMPPPVAPPVSPQMPIA